jgi:LPXTG-motif cell wall-anchored protein
LYIYAIIGAVVVLVGAVAGYFIFKKCKKEKL